MCVVCMYVWEGESESCMMANCILKGPKELSQKTLDTTLGVKSNCHVIHEMIEAMDGVMARYTEIVKSKDKLKATFKNCFIISHWR